MTERDLRYRSQSAALNRHYLDSLIGLPPVRAQAAERAVWWQHEVRLVEWARSGLQVLRAGVLIEAAQMLIGSSCAAVLVLNFLARENKPGAALLLIYWALGMPTLGREIATLVRRVPAYRNLAERLLEPMRMAIDEATGDDRQIPSGTPVEITFESIEVSRSGRPVLDGIDLRIRPGEHVAVVGRSGAGKSTLVGLLLGWHVPTAGEVRIDGLPLDAARLANLRQTTAWVDPSVQLWNRSLFDNIRYGNGTSLIGDIGAVVDTADLRHILERLPDGLQSSLGESGRLTSGGEGQRVRFARALLKEHVRLALLDEPFRGLDLEQRRELLRRARDLWRETTLICVTHDIADTLTFERVLVVDNGRIAEDGEPGALSRSPDSLFAKLLQAERASQSQFSRSGLWKRWELQNGKIVELEDREGCVSWKELA
jgi:ATP-binding cassette subfamily B protein